MSPPAPIAVGTTLRIDLCDGRQHAMPGNAATGRAMLSMLVGAFPPEQSSAHCLQVCRLTGLTPVGLSALTTIWYSPSPPLPQKDSQKRFFRRRVDDRCKTTADSKDSAQSAAVIVSSAIPGRKNYNLRPSFPLSFPPVSDLPPHFRSNPSKTSLCVCNHDYRSFSAVSSRTFRGNGLFVKRVRHGRPECGTPATLCHKIDNHDDICRCADFPVGAAVRL